MKLTKRNMEALVALRHGYRVKGRNSGGAISRMYGRLEAAGLVCWEHGRRALTVAGSNVVCAEEARVAKMAEAAAE